MKMMNHSAARDARRAGWQWLDATMARQPGAAAKEASAPALFPSATIRFPHLFDDDHVTFGGNASFVDAAYSAIKAVNRHDAVMRTALGHMAKPRRIRGRVQGTPEQRDVGACPDTTSVLLDINVPVDLARRVLACIPPDIFPLSTDDAHSLAKRLGKSKWLDDFRKDGKRVNASTMPQPRRFTCGLEDTTRQHVDDDGRNVSLLTHYPAPYVNDNCNRIPDEFFELMQRVWLDARDELPDGVCSERPPDSLQLMLYYRLFGSRVGRHRDYYDVRQYAKWLDGDEPKWLGTQMPYSITMVYSMGPLEMDLVFSCAPADNPKAPRTEYVVIEPLMVIRLPHGSLFLLSVADDLRYCHEVEIAYEDGSPLDWRIAFVMRWLQSSKRVREFLMN